MQNQDPKERGKGFASNLYALRCEAQLTQQQVAKLLSINRTTYTKYETGVTEPGINTICKLAEIYGVDVNTLLDGTLEDRASDHANTSASSERAEKQILSIFRSLTPSFQKRFTSIGFLLAKECEDQSYRSRSKRKTNE